MKEEGIVHKIRGTYAVVRFPRKTACEHCNMCLKPRNEMFVEVKVKNTLGAKEGDKVAVVLGERAVISASLIVYTVPLATTAAGLTATYKLGLAICLPVTAGALIAGLVAVALIDKFLLRNKQDFAPQMKEIIQEPNNQ